MQRRRLAGRRLAGYLTASRQLQRLFLSKSPIYLPGLRSISRAYRLNGFVILEMSILALRCGRGWGLRNSANNIFLPAEKIYNGREWERVLVCADIEPPT